MTSNLAPDDPAPSPVEYTAESTRPLVSMLFIAPLLFIYEVGVVVLGPHALRNGADAWLRHTLEWIGFGQYFLLPLLTCAALLAWHHTRRDAWTVRYGVMSTMLMESLLFAALLFVLAHLQRAVVAPPAALTPQGISRNEPAGNAQGRTPPDRHRPEAGADRASLASVCDTTARAEAGTLGRIVGYCGAGIYEELLFRLILVPGVAGLLHWFGLGWRASLVWSIVATSLLFSAAHYQFFSPGGYAFDWNTFAFRFVAGLYFAVLFVTRGFGITTASHAFYNILVELL
ncbi:MAG: CPBP family intramembrane metalloprotease [Planctomycetes bacterium]|nr:CPBP family intramembrane metalloprotease [Planctomycetota bacterium]